MTLKIVRKDFQNTIIKCLVQKKVVFDSFWNLSYEEIKAHVVAKVTLRPITTQTKRHPSRIKNTHEYFLIVRAKIYQ